MPLKNPNTFVPNTVVYSGSSLPSSSAEITAMMTNLQNAYSGSDIRNNQAIASLMATSVGNSLATLGTSIISNQL
jgi:hypothetical protein